MVALTCAQSHHSDNPWACAAPPLVATVEGITLSARKGWRCFLPALLAVALVGPAEPALAQLITQQAELVGTGAGGSADQGFSVALSANGHTAIVGGPFDNNNAGGGAAWVFTRSGGTWSQQGNKLAGSGATGNAIQGWSVALSADGNTAILGGYLDGGGVGAAWVFTRSGGVWTQQGRRRAGT